MRSGAAVLKMGETEKMDTKIRKLFVRHRDLVQFRVYLSLFIQDLERQIADAENVLVVPQRRKTQGGRTVSFERNEDGED